MIDAALDDALDRWAERAFAGAEGERRLAPHLARWAEQVGEVRASDDDAIALVRARTDWALVEGRAAAPASDDERVLATSVCGLFEVWPTPGGRAWLRDRTAGIALPLHGTLDLRPVDHGPAALWELRVVLRDDALVAVRPPLSYPTVVLEALERLRPPASTPPVPGGPAALLQALRRARLWHARAARQDPRPGFAAAIARAGPGDSDAPGC
ncbi:MAG: hypothetical protein K1X88_27590 [Nannocystaceae bacterium]|nr:hypothetical protein [Nannocystaceae bacterium]